MKNNLAIWSHYQFNMQQQGSAQMRKVRMKHTLTHVDTTRRLSALPNSHDWTPVLFWSPSLWERSKTFGDAWQRSSGSGNTSWCEPTEAQKLILPLPTGCSFSIGKLLTDDTSVGGGVAITVAVVIKEKQSSKRQDPTKCWLTFGTFRSTAFRNTCRREKDVLASFAK